MELMTMNRNYCLKKKLKKKKKKIIEMYNKKIFLIIQIEKMKKNF